MMTATCKDRVREELEGRLSDLRRLWKAYQEGDEEVEDLGSFPDYGLCFDYVPQGTFRDQEEGYFRYQISWGGPSDEFRFYVNLDFSVHRIEYWFLDWFDGASITLSGKDKSFMTEVFDFFNEIGSVENEFRRAQEG
jgi:hypothetical protein